MVFFLGGGWGCKVGFRVFEGWALGHILTLTNSSSFCTVASGNPLKGTASPRFCRVLGFTCTLKSLPTLQGFYKSQ